MDLTFWLISIVLVIFIFLVIIKTKLGKKQIEKSIEKYKKEIYETKKGEIENQVQKDLSELYEKRQRVVKEIEEKTVFNNSLKVIREDELDRLLKTQEEEKRKTLEEKISNWEQTQIRMVTENLNTLKESHQQIKENLEQEINEIQIKLNDFRNQREAVNEAILRERAIQEAESFFCICVPHSDIEDISVLKTIEPRLKNKEALNKLIYDVFIKRPLGELIKRVMCTGTVSGIYKITYLKTGEAYIGKSTNIATRWQNHVKTACGLDGAATSTFHVRMREDGIWNYTFEILEETEKEKLTEKEKFYIDLYQTDKQLNMKRG